MVYNTEKLKKEIRKVSEHNDISVQVIYTLFFARQLLKRIQTIDKDCFILRGGFGVFSITRNFYRTTSDIDLLMKREFDSSLKILERAINDTTQDNIIYENVSKKKSMCEREYNGYTYKLLCKLDKLKVHMSIDIGYEKTYETSIVTVPQIIDTDTNLKFESYTIETTLSEKLHALLAYKKDMTRMKDLFDIYILEDLGIDYDKLTTLLVNKINDRNIITIDDLETEFLDKEFIDLKKSFWINYLNKDDLYMIEFEEVIEIVKSLLENLKDIYNNSTS